MSTSEANVEIGAFVLETLTTGMYPNPMDAIRELVQNGADSLRRGEETGVLQQGEGRIELLVDADHRSLTVRDNGVGIASDSAEKRLLGIGKTTKHIETDAGFRGIGRLASIAYCDSLVFRTSAKGDAHVCEVELHCEAMRKSFSPGNLDERELAALFADNVDVRISTANEETHFFEVHLQDVSSKTEMFLDPAELEGYLKQVAPVEYDAQKYVFSGAIQDWVAAHSVPLHTVTLVIVWEGNERQVFKPYKNRYRTQRGAYDVKVLDVKFFPEDPTNAGYWIWYADTELLGAIADPSVAGLRLRKQNIALGGAATVAELFAEVAESNARFNNYFVGEIHVLSTECIPNGRRDAMEMTGEWPRIRTEIVDFLKERCEEIRKVSESRNRPTAKIVTEVERTIDGAAESLRAPLLTRQEKGRLLVKLEKAKAKVETALSADKRKDQERELLEPLIQQVEAMTDKVGEASEATDVLSCLDRKQRKVVREILEVLYEILDETAYHAAVDAIGAKLGCRPEQLGE